MATVEIEADRTVMLEGLLEQARGVIGRYPEPGEVYVFEFDAVDDRSVHMIGVLRPLRVRWFRGGELVADEVLQPWLGRSSHEADLVIESRPPADS